MKILFAVEASKELDDAVNWYNEEKDGLGYDFVKIVDETILRIARYPYFNTEIRSGVYRALVKRFPFGVYYSVDDNSDTLYIYAIAHLHRKPMYWVKRIS